LCYLLKTVEAMMLGDVVISSMNTKPLPKDQRVWKPEWFETCSGGKRGKGMGPALKPLDSGTPYGIRLLYGFALLRGSE
jgi:hypothetical protein